MGEVYSRFARACLSVGTTPLLFAHCKKDRTNGPPDLDDLAFAGVAEFVRQWILVSRRDPYAGDGVHKLWLSIGGSAGHAFLGHLDVEEGVAGDHFEGRYWSTTVTAFGDVARANKESRDEKKAEERTTDEQNILNLIDQIVRLNEPATLSPIEKLLIDMIGVTWLASSQAEIAASQVAGSLQHAKLRFRRAESAQKRFLSAVKMLTTLRSTVGDLKGSAAGTSKPRKK